MHTELITPMVLTHNEAPNIGRSLDRLKWAHQILVVDSYSSDETVEIVRNFPQALLVQRKFDSFAGQCNYGLEQIQTPWVLSLDADYLLSDELVEEIQTLSFSDEIVGYAARFKYCVYGKPLRGTLYPPRTVLYRKGNASYFNDGHGHRVQVCGNIGALASYILHDDRKSFSRWLQSQDRYMIAEAKKLTATPKHELGSADRIRKTKLLAPFIVLVYCLIAKGAALDGWPGWYYTLQRVVAEIILALRLIEAERAE